MADEVLTRVEHLLDINYEEPVKNIQIPALKSANAGICILSANAWIGKGNFRRISGRWLVPVHFEVVGEIGNQWVARVAPHPGPLSQAGEWSADLLGDQREKIVGCRRAPKSPLAGKPPATSGCTGSTRPRVLTLSRRYSTLHP